MATTTIKVAISGFGVLQPATIELMRPMLDENILLCMGDALRDCHDFDILINGNPTYEDLAASSRLRHVIMPWAGVSPALKTLMAQFPQVTLHNSHHNAVTTAEMAIALLMAAARQISSVDQKMHRLDWSPRDHSDSINYVLWGQTALILGFGAIGQHVGKVCQALGMNIIGIRRNPDTKTENGVEAEVYGPEDLHQVLPRVNVLIITMPHTDETAGMICAEEFALMPDDSLLVNVGRGAVVDQHALYNALTNGKLRAAGIDVWYHYPAQGQTICQPADAPLHELENLIMSPHRGGAGGTGEAENFRAREMAKMLNAAARGEIMPNAVDLSLGY